MGYKNVRNSRSWFTLPSPKPSMLLNYFYPFILFVQVAFAAFGVTTSGSSLVVDSGAGLVTRSELSLQCPTFYSDIVCSPVNTADGDITSLNYNGNELQDQTVFTQLSSGLGSASVSSYVANNIAVVTIQTSTIVSESLAFCTQQTSPTHRPLDPLLHRQIRRQYSLHRHICFC